MRTTRFARAAALALAAVAFAACADSKPPNVVLVIADTMRADKMGAYGHPAGLTPFLDQLASEGVVFENASSHAPWTLPSTASLLTSLHPRQHGAGGRAPQFTGLDESVQSLPELLHERGYATHAVINVLFLSETFGLARGFDSVDSEHYKSNVEVRVAERTTEAALEWLASDPPEPWFLLVHYFDPHAVYAPPQPFRHRFAAERDKEDESFVYGTRPFMIQLRFGDVELVPDEIERAERLYEGEIAYTDGQIGRLFDGLRANGDLDDSVVVFTADHGEEFLEHGGFEHGHTLYPELTHIPLVLRYPPRLAPGRVAQSVAHVDVAPTICELLDLAPPRQYVGRSLLELIGDPAAPDRPVLAHGNMWGAPLTSLRSGDELLIQPGDGRPAELYDWRRDPACERDLAAERPQRVTELAAELERREAALEAFGNGSAVELTPEMAETLRGLGYGETAPDGDVDEPER